MGKRKRELGRKKAERKELREQERTRQELESQQKTSVKGPVLALLALGSITAAVVGTIKSKKESDSTSDQNKSEQTIDFQRPDITKIPGFDITKTDHQLRFPQLQEDIQKSAQSFMQMAESFNKEDHRCKDNQESMTRTISTLKKWIQTQPLSIQKTLTALSPRIDNALNVLLSEADITFNPDYYVNQDQTITPAINVDKIQNRYEVDIQATNIPDILKPYITKPKKVKLIQTKQDIHHPEILYFGGYDQHLNLIKLTEKNFKEPHEMPRTLANELGHALFDQSFPHILQKINDQVRGYTILQTEEAFSDYCSLLQCQTTAEAIHFLEKVGNHPSYKISLELIQQAEQLPKQNLTLEKIRTLWKQKLTPLLQEIAKIDNAIPIPVSQIRELNQIPTGQKGVLIMTNAGSIEVTESEILISPNNNKDHPSLLEYAKRRGLIRK